MKNQLNTPNLFMQQKHSKAALAFPVPAKKQRKISVGKLVTMSPSHCALFRLSMMLLLLNNVVNAQTNALMGCGNQIIITQPSSQSVQSMQTQNCTSQSATYINKYRNQDFYIPITNPIIAEKIIPINIVVFGNNDGTGFPFEIRPQCYDYNSGQTPVLINMPNYYDSQGNPIATYYDEFGNLIPDDPLAIGTDLTARYETWLNQQYYSPQTPTLPGGTQICNPQTLPNTKIRYVIKHYYFYMNSDVNNSTCTSCTSGILGQAYLDLAARTHHFDLNPPAKDNINCYLMKTFNVPNGPLGWSYEKIPYIQTTDPEALPYVSSSNQSGTPNSIWVDNSDFFYFHTHLAHELGHRLGIFHIEMSNSEKSFFYTQTHNYFDDIYQCAYPSLHSPSNLMNSQTNGNGEISPKQMGRMHRALQTDINTLGTGSETRHFAYGYSTTPHNINTNETWDFTFKSYNDIVVKKGATLTLKCRLEMVPEAKIVVEKGGQLIVDGGTITAARNAGPEHEGLWKGIVIFGTPAKNQIQHDAQGDLYQGLVELKNNAVIELAETGIYTGYYVNTVSGGGIVKCTNSTFRNCKSSIILKDYVNFNNISYVRDCIFETTQALPNNILPSYFITCKAVYGVHIYSSSFSNNYAAANNTAMLGNGVYIHVSKIDVTGLLTNPVLDYCDEGNANWHPNKFENLNKGIVVVNTGNPTSDFGRNYNGVGTTNITQNLFTKCVTAIESNGAPAITITQNKIYLGNNPLNTADNNGIVQRGYSGYKIEGNCIENAGNYYSNSAAVVVVGTGGNNNEVYRNISRGNQTGFLSNGKNRSSAISASQQFRGLQFLCNNNDHNFPQTYDFAVAATPATSTNPMMGIRFYQGGNGNGSANQKAAGNLFTHTNFNNESDFYNNTLNPINYLHFNSNNETPWFTSGNVTLLQGTSNTCPSSLGSGGNGIILNPTEYAQLLAKFAIHNSQFLATAIIYNNLIDGGNTHSLLQTITNNSNSSIEDIKNQLLTISPNLSEEVVRKFTDGTTILTNADLLTVIAANPDVACSEELLYMLKNKTNPMDEWMIDFLREAGTYQTNRTMLEQTFAQKQYEREADAWAIVRHLLNDTTADSLNHAQLRYWLYTIGSPHAIYMIADDYLAMGNPETALQIVNQTQVKELDRYEIAERNAMLQWYTMHQQLIQEGRTVEQLNPTELELMRKMASNDNELGIAAVLAANVYELAKGENLLPEIIYPGNESSARMANTKPNKRRTLKLLQPISNNSEIIVSNYPNPADDLFNIDISKINNFNSLQIIDVNGKIVKGDFTLKSGVIEIDTRKLLAGSYTVKLYDTNSKILSNLKLVVIHN